MTNQTKPSEGREIVARIIDPSSWRVMDSYLAEVKRKYAGQDAAYDPDSFKDKPSLAKADAILSALNTKGSESQVQSPPVHDGFLLKSDVIAMLHRLAEKHADLAIYGEESSSRTREAMEAALTHARCAVALMPITASRESQVQSDGRSEVQPVAWLIKDFADGWFLTSDKTMVKSAAEGGATIQPLYVQPPSPEAVTSPLGSPQTTPPEGWAMVPREPDGKMVSAAWSRGKDHGATAVLPTTFKAIVAAAIAAAPQPPFSGTPEAAFGLTIPLPLVQEEMGWMPIETAWKAGTDRVLVTDGQYVGQGEWHPRDLCWIECDGIAPTMWRPLPPPPQTESEG